VSDDADVRAAHVGTICRHLTDSQVRCHIACALRIAADRRRSSTHWFWRAEPRSTAVIFA